MVLSATLLRRATPPPDLKSGENEEKREGAKIFTIRSRGGGVRLCWCVALCYLRFVY